MLFMLMSSINANAQTLMFVLQLSLEKVKKSSTGLLVFQKVKKKANYRRDMTLLTHERLRLLVESELSLHKSEK